MTRYSDLIAHFQKLIEKEGDRPFARNDGPWTCGFFLQQVTSENRKLNKAIHRKNRHIERLRKENDDLKEKLADAKDPMRRSEHKPFLIVPEDGDTQESMMESIRSLLNEHFEKGMKAAAIRANGVMFHVTPS